MPAADIVRACTVIWKTYVLLMYQYRLYSAASDRHAGAEVGSGAEPDEPEPEPDEPAVLELEPEPEP